MWDKGIRIGVNAVIDYVYLVLVSLFPLQLFLAKLQYSITVGDVNSACYEMTVL